MKNSTKKITKKSDSFFAKFLRKNELAKQVALALAVPALMFGASPAEARYLGGDITYSNSELQSKETISIGLGDYRIGVRTGITDDTKYLQGIKLRISGSTDDIDIGGVNYDYGTDYTATAGIPRLIIGSYYNAADTNDMTGNSVEVLNVSTANFAAQVKIYGGVAEEKYTGITMRDNSVILKNTKNITNGTDGGVIFAGAYSAVQNALQENYVEIAGSGTISSRYARVYGADSSGADSILTGNYVNLSSGTIGATGTTSASAIYGANATGADSTLTGNFVDISGTADIKAPRATIYGANATNRKKFDFKR